MWEFIKKYKSRVTSEQQGGKEMAKYVMALDAGTTSNRCILFNEKGDMCAVAQKEFTQHMEMLFQGLLCPLHL